MNVLRRWFENAILDPLFTWALYRDVKPRKHFGATDVVVCVGSFAVFLFVVSSVLASSAPAPALHFAAHAKAHAAGKALEQLADVHPAVIASAPAR